MRYGTWITNEGKIIDVPTKCGHIKIIPYGDAFDDGHISTIEQREDHFREPCELSISVRIYALDSVAPKALSTLQKYIKDADCSDFFIETLRPDKVYMGLGRIGVHTKRKALAAINQIIKDKKALQESEMADAPEAGLLALEREFIS